MRDWEDLELSECDEGFCLYVADVGDNEARRSRVQLYRLAEPDPHADTVASAETLTVSFPDGPRDVEALFILPGERIHLVVKGRAHPVAVFRYPGVPRADNDVILEEVQRLSDGPRSIPRQVTGASASLDGRTVVIRTYETLGFFQVVSDSLVPLEQGATLNLRPALRGAGRGSGSGARGFGGAHQ